MFFRSQRCVMSTVAPQVLRHPCPSEHASLPTCNMIIPATSLEPGDGKGLQRNAHRQMISQSRSPAQYLRLNCLPAHVCHLRKQTCIISPCKPLYSLHCSPRTQGNCRGDQSGTMVFVIARLRRSATTRYQVIVSCKHLRTGGES